MIRYRKYRESDLEQIKTLCETNKICYDFRTPVLGFVAEEEETGKIVGFIHSHSSIVLEPLVSPHQPAVAVKLYCMMDGALQAAGTDIVIAHVRENHTKLREELKRLGFKQVEEGYVVYKRTL